MMTPERLDEIEVHLRRHPTSPNTVPLALELVAALRDMGIAHPSPAAAEVVVEEVPVPAVVVSSSTDAPPASTTVEPVEPAVTPPASPKRVRR